LQGEHEEQWKRTPSSCEEGVDRGAHTGGGNIQSTVNSKEEERGEKSPRVNKSC